MKKKMRNALELFVESPAEGDRLLHYGRNFKILSKNYVDLYYEFDRGINVRFCFLEQYV